MFYEINAKAVLVATGGAAGLYRPNNPGFSRHKMWYPPFNTGAGYAMGINAGAEMTTFEMRFIALRCKDTIAPTGTIAQAFRQSSLIPTAKCMRTNMVLQLHRDFTEQLLRTERAEVLAILELRE